MDRLISNHTVPLAKADRAPKKVIDPTPQYATDGDPATGVPATYLTAAHYNSLMDEIVNAIEAGGLDPDKDDWGQLAQVFTKIINRFGNIKEVGKDGNGVYVIVNENDKDQKTYILSPSDLDDIKKRLGAAEGTIITHTSRLDNYGEAINRIFSQELPSKAALNGSSKQEFFAKYLNAPNIWAGGMQIGGTVAKSPVQVGDPEVGLWAWSPQLDSNEAGLDRKAILSLFYNGSDSVQNTDPSTRVVISVTADRSQASTADPNLTSQDAIISSRRTHISSKADISGDVILFRTLLVNGKATFKNGTEGAKGDLSENYKADKTTYKEGQVMMYSVGGDSEVELCTDPQHVFSVVSSEYAHLMNAKDKNDPDYTRYVPIALTGRVPVLVEGPVMKRERITPTNRGTARAAKENSAEIIIGRALHDDFNEGTRLVECRVQAIL